MKWMLVICAIAGVLGCLCVRALMYRESTSPDKTQAWRVVFHSPAGEAWWYYTLKEPEIDTKSLKGVPSGFVRVWPDNNLWIDSPEHIRYGTHSILLPKGLVTIEQMDMDRLDDERKHGLFEETQGPPKRR